MAYKTKHTHGFVLGKFMPLHKGHMHLLRVASASSEALTIMVCSLPDDPISGDLRVNWVRELFPQANVVHQSTPIPQEPKEHPQFWDIWRSTIERHVPISIDAVFASEDYGWRLARELNAAFVPVDPKRAMVPVSGSTVRSDPYTHWHYLPAPVRAHHVKRVAVLGPESVGKSTLVARLAEHFETIGVEEYARQFFDALVREKKRKPGEFRYSDLSAVARGQHALENSLAYEANKVLITDTDVLTTMTWSDHLYGKHERWMEDLARSTTYDLTLVLHPNNTTYVPDGQRVMAAQAERLRFTQKLEQNLKNAGRPYMLLTGGYEDRFQKALYAIERLFE